MACFSANQDDHLKVKETSATVAEAGKTGVSHRVTLLCWLTVGAYQNSKRAANRFYPSTKY